MLCPNDNPTSQGYVMQISPLITLLNHYTIYLFFMLIMISQNTFFWIWLVGYLMLAILGWHFATWSQEKLTSNHLKLI